MVTSCLERTGERMAIIEITHQGVIAGRVPGDVENLLAELDELLGR